MHGWENQGWLELLGNQGYIVMTNRITGIPVVERCRTEEPGEIIAARPEELPGQQQPIELVVIDISDSEEDLESLTQRQQREVPVAQAASPCRGISAAPAAPLASPAASSPASPSPIRTRLRRPVRSPRSPSTPRRCKLPRAAGAEGDRSSLPKRGGGSPSPATAARVEAEGSRRTLELSDEHGGDFKRARVCRPCHVEDLEANRPEAEDEVVREPEWDAGREQLSGPEN